MNVAVVGCGLVGSEIVRDLAASNDVSSVIAADVSTVALKRVHRWPKVTTRKMRPRRHKEDLLRIVRRADVVCCALPGRISFESLQSLVKAGHNVVDISYTPQNPFGLHRTAVRNGSTLVPQCGVAPGFSNMCVGDASRRLEKINAVRIYVGGLPQKPVQPFNYHVVFSLDDVISEYTRPVHIIENGRHRIVEALSGRGFLQFPNVGKLEFFLTDGLGTLPRSFPRVREMREMTLRYPGHVGMMNTLRVLGFFESRKMPVNGTKVEPRRVTMELFKSAFSAGPPEDLLVFRVEVEGVYKGKRVLARYSMLDRFNSAQQVSAMARTTSYPCTSAALLLGQGKLRQHGVLPPERIARNSEHFEFVRSRLSARGVMTTVQSRVLGS